MPVKPGLIAEAAICSCNFFIFCLHVILSVGQAKASNSFFGRRTALPSPSLYTMYLSIGVKFREVVLSANSGTTLSSKAIDFSAGSGPSQNDDFVVERCKRPTCLDGVRRAIEICFS